MAFSVFHGTFQSTLPRRERPHSLPRCRWRLRFQSTLPRRERRNNQAGGTQGAYFNPRSREGSDKCGRKNPGKKGISIHAPAKGATGDEAVTNGFCDISIHAPAKGATYVRQCQRPFFPISIHAPAKGATGCGSSYSSGWFIFQSTLPRRERQSLIVSCFSGFTISIHAPAKGATRNVTTIQTASANFNPRSREGSDCKNHIFL